MNRLQADSNEANAVTPREEGDSDGGGCVNMVGDGKKLVLVILFMAPGVWSRINAQIYIFPASAPP